MANSGILGPFWADPELGRWLGTWLAQDPGIGLGTLSEGWVDLGSQNLGIGSWNLGLGVGTSGMGSLYLGLRSR